MAVAARAALVMVGGDEGGGSDGSGGEGGGGDGGAYPDDPSNRSQYRS